MSQFFDTINKGKVVQNILDTVGQDSTFEQLSKSMEPEELEKAMGHKYFKREGTPGNYKYYYTEAEYKQAKGEDENLGSESNRFRDIEENNPKLKFGDLDFNNSFVLIREGGSIGSNNNNTFIPHFRGNAYKTSNNKEELKELVKYKNSKLSPGEKKYYGIKYSVKEVTPSIRKYMLSRLDNNSQDSKE